MTQHSPQGIEVFPAESNGGDLARPVTPDSSRDHFASEIAGAFVSKYGMPEAGKGMEDAANRIYAFANAMIAARSRLEMAEQEALAGARAAAIVRQNAPQHSLGVRR